MGQKRKKKYGHILWNILMEVEVGKKKKGWQTWKGCEEEDIEKEILV